MYSHPKLNYIKDRVKKRVKPDECKQKKRIFNWLLILSILINKKDRQVPIFTIRLVQFHLSPSSMLLLVQLIDLFPH